MSNPEDRGLTREQDLAIIEVEARKRAVTYHGAAGSAYLMDARVLHGSAPNLSVSPWTLFIVQGDTPMTPTRWPSITCPTASTRRSWLVWPLDEYAPRTMKWLYPRCPPLPPSSPFRR